MGAITQILGARTAITAASLPTLASANYTTSSAIDLTASDPIDLLLEVEATPGSVSGNKQLVVFAQASLDGTNYQTGPTSGATTTDEAVLTLVGVLPLPSNSTLQRKVFSVAAAYGGALPHYLKFVFKNDCGSALTTGEAHYSAVIGSVV